MLEYTDGGTNVAETSIEEALKTMKKMEMIIKTVCVVLVVSLVSFIAPSVPDKDAYAMGAKSNCNDGKKECDHVITIEFVNKSSYKILQNWNDLSSKGKAGTQNAIIRNIPAHSTKSWEGQVHTTCKLSLFSVASFQSSPNSPLHKSKLSTEVSICNRDAKRIVIHFSAKGALSINAVY